jgi:hypothetical protein
MPPCVRPSIQFPPSHRELWGHVPLYLQLSSPVATVSALVGLALPSLVLQLSECIEPQNALVDRFEFLDPPQTRLVLKLTQRGYFWAPMLAVLGSVQHILAMKSAASDY